jgi:hypothetical protein
MNPVTEAVAYLLASLEGDGGAFAIAGIVLVGVFVLARYVIDSQRKDSATREVSLQRHYADLQQRNEEALFRERDNAHQHQSQTNRVIGVIERNTEVITTLVSASEKQGELLNRIDRHFTRPPQVRKPPATQHGDE